MPEVDEFNLVPAFTPVPKTETPPELALQGTVFETRVDLKPLEAEVSRLIEALGYSFKLKVRAGDVWALDLQQHTLVFPKQLLEEEGVHRTFGALAREVSRLFYSRPITAPESSAPARYIHAVAEETRILKMFEARYPGTGRWIRQLFPTPEKPTDLRGLPRVQQFGEAIQYAYANDGALPALMSPEVRRALAASEKELEQAIALPRLVDLRVDDMTDEQTVEEALAAFSSVEQTLVPQVELLYQQDLLDALSQDGSGSSDSTQEGQSQQSQPTEAQRKSAQESLDQQLDEATQQHEAQVEAEPSEAQSNEGQRSQQTQGPQPQSADGQTSDASDEPSSPGTDAAQEPSEGQAAPASPSAPDAPPGNSGLSNPQEAPLSELVKEMLAQAMDEQLASLDKKAPAAESTHYKNYQERARILGPVIADLAHRLETIIERDDDAELEGYYRSGKLDRRKATQSVMREIATGESNPYQYLRRIEPESRTSEFALVMDTSQSMEQDGKSDAARDALVVFAEALAKLKIRHSILGFAGDPKAVKGLDKTLDDSTKGKLFSKLEFGDGSGTNDVKALYAAKAVLKTGEPGAQKVMIFVTDGEGQKEMPEEVAKAEAEGYVVVGIGLGPRAEQVKSSYPHEFVHVPSVEALPTELGEVLMGLLYRAGRGN